MQTKTPTRWAVTALCSAHLLLAARSVALITTDSFSPSVDFLTGASPFQVISVDIDGDGKLDLITSNNGGGDASVLRNLGSGPGININSFDLPVNFPAGIGPAGIAAGDIDGDGKKDLVIANFNVSTIAILKNTSVSGTINSSSFAPAVEYASAPGCAYVILVDIDGDGKLDVVTANQPGQSLSVFRNQRTVGVIDGNTLAARVDIPVTGGPLGVAAGDLDGDGRPELVCGDFPGGAISVIRNVSSPGSLAFEPRVDLSGTGTPLHFIIADLDSDGKRDIITANQGGANVSVFKNTTSGVGSFTGASFAARVDFGVGVNPRGLAVVDLDADGKPDIATSDYGSGTVSILNNITPTGSISSSSFAPVVQFFVGFSPYVIGSGDLDGDGDIDLFTPNISASVVNVLQNLSAASAPVISQQPTSQTVLVGNTATFTVSAIGTPPLSYQWRLNGVNIPGATQSTLTLPNVQLSQAGNYSVRISNSLGTVTSADAVLTVTLGPTKLTVGIGAIQTGRRIKLPVVATLNGKENAIGFSLAFDVAQLKYISAEAGKGTPANMAFNVNSTLATSGRLGFGFALPAGLTFQQRTQAMVVVTLEANATANTGVSAVQLVDLPIERQVSDKYAKVAECLYADGSVTIQSVGYEGDVTPGPSGDQKIQMIDWVQVGRFAAGLDVPETPMQYQRADCAPRTSRGNGQLSVADWVQAGRYATSLDPLTATGGPTRNGGPPPPPALADVGSVERVLQVMDGMFGADELIEVPVRFHGVGNENAFGFSVAFDAGVLRFVDTVQSDSMAGAWANVNADKAAEGLVGLAIALPLAQPLASGDHTLVTLRFQAAPGAPLSVPLRLADVPALREVVDIEANTLETRFLDGSVELLTSAVPTLHITHSTSSVVLSWALVGSEGYVLQTSSGIGGAEWVAVSDSRSEAAGTRSVKLLPAEAQRFFRLAAPRKPL